MRLRKRLNMKMRRGAKALGLEGRGGGTKAHPDFPGSVMVVHVVVGCGIEISGGG